MRFLVTGQRVETGRRESLTVEAESKAAAERKGRELGLEVRSVRDVSDGMPLTTPVDYGARRGGGGGLMRTVVVLLILLAAAWAAWTFAVPRFR